MTKNFRLTALRGAALAAGLSAACIVGPVRAQDQATEPTAPAASGTTLPAATQPVAETPVFGMTLRDAATGRVVVESVEDGSIGAEFGLQDGDVIRTVNKARVASSTELTRQLNDLRAGEKLALGVQRGREALQIVVAGPQAGAVPTRIGMFGAILRLDPKNRLAVSQVTPGTAAEQAGLKPGDTLVSIGDFKPASVDDFVDYATRLATGARTSEEVAIVVNRGDEEHKLILALPDPTANPRAQGTAGRPMQRAVVLGVTVAETENGLVVTEVLEGSPAQAAGIRPGDAILAVDAQKVPTYAGLAETVQGIPANQRVAVDVLRDGKAFVANATSITTQAQLPDVALEAGAGTAAPPAVELQEQVRQLQIRVDELSRTVEALVQELELLRQQP